MFDWAPDFDVSAFENGSFAANFQRHFLFRYALLDEILVGRRLDSRLAGTFRCHNHRNDGIGRRHRRCRILLDYQFRFVDQIIVGRAFLAGIARLGFGRSRRRVTVIGRLCQHLAQR